MDSNREFDYHKHNSTYISDYIKFADAKAGVALSLNVVLIGIFAKTLKSTWKINSLKLSDLLLLASLLLLAFAMYYILWRVLWPRYPKNTQLYLSWGGLGSYASIDDYYNHLKQQPDTKFLKDMAAQNYALAQVCIKKYRDFERAVIFLTLGTVTGVFGWLLT